MAFLESLKVRSSLFFFRGYAIASSKKGFEDIKDKVSLNKETHPLEEYKLDLQQFTRALSKFKVLPNAFMNVSVKNISFKENNKRLFLTYKNEMNPVFYVPWAPVSQAGVTLRKVYDPTNEPQRSYYEISLRFEKNFDKLCQKLLPGNTFTSSSSVSQEGRYVNPYVKWIELLSQKYANFLLSNKKHYPLLHKIPSNKIQSSVVTLSIKRNEAEDVINVKFKRPVSRADLPLSKVFDHKGQRLFLKEPTRTGEIICLSTTIYPFLFQPTEKDSPIFGLTQLINGIVKLC
ncbi:uncharacterized protein LOC135119643 [Zophobas morio]|uniref:uncharacterized protein LOC135119643 n=1 Tax=Zophobas morio TaxID=2755281 RepID=UPI0030835BD9